MDFLIFNQLDLKEKQRIVNNQGIFLLSREKFLLKIDLYSVSNFFVEVWLTNDEVFDQAILEIIGFNNRNISENYLKALELDNMGIICSNNRKSS